MPQRSQTSPVAGLSLVEVIVVVGIVVVVAGMLTPVFFRAKHRVNILSSAEKLRQLHIATMIYRTDHDGDGRYGDIPVMGLPPATYVIFNRFGLPETTLQSSCGHHPSVPMAILNIDYRPGRGGPAFAADALVFRENLILFQDMNCSDAEVLLENPFQSKTGIGILLGGRAVLKRQTGDYWSPLWWSEPEM